MKTLITIATYFSIIMGSEVACAQTNTEGSQVYRVSAYMNGDHKVISQSNSIEIVPELAIYVPNAFTPNDDKLNDTFGPVGEGLVEYKMQVYNRWGNLIFESTDTKKQWDGTYMDVLCKQDVYIYKISARGENTQRINKMGEVTLLQ
jgi:gliding motility-associated-like protein